MSLKVFGAVYNIFSMNPIIRRGASASSRLDRLSEPPLGFNRVYLVGSSADEPHCPQVPIDSPRILRSFYRRIGTSEVDRARRAPCSSSSCYAWHAALLLDVCRRHGSRYRGNHVSGRFQSDCTDSPSPVFAARDRNVPDIFQPRPSVALSVIFVAHRLAQGRMLSLERSIMGTSFTFGVTSRFNP